MELALLLPVLCFIGLLTVDYARIIPAAITIADCARHGALYEAGSDTFKESMPYSSAEQAALAGAGGLEPLPAVEMRRGTDALGNAYVEVTVSYTFRTITGYPGIPRSVDLSRTVRMPEDPENRSG